MVASVTAGRVPAGGTGSHSGCYWWYSTSAHMAELKHWSSTTSGILRDDYEAVVRAGKFIAILKAKALRVVADRSNSC